MTLIFAFGAVYALPPLILYVRSVSNERHFFDTQESTWVPNVITHPVQKRAVAIALVNALGNSASIYGVFLWPATDAPRFAGFYRLFRLS